MESQEILEKTAEDNLLSLEMQLEDVIGELSVAFGMLKGANRLLELSKTSANKPQ